MLTGLSEVILLLSVYHSPQAQCCGLWKQFAFWLTTIIEGLGFLKLKLTFHDRCQKHAQAMLTHVIDFVVRIFLRLCFCLFLSKFYVNSNAHTCF